MDQKVDRFKIPELAVLGSAKKTGARAIVIGSGFGGLAAWPGRYWRAGATGVDLARHTGAVDWYFQGLY